MLSGRRRREAVKSLSVKGKWIPTEKERQTEKWAPFLKWKEIPQRKKW